MITSFPVPFLPWKNLKILRKSLLLYPPMHFRKSLTGRDALLLRSIPLEPNESNPVLLEVFGNLYSSIAEEMGTALCRAALSPNIKERRDFSCLVCDKSGELVAQAAHIPVHLGSAPLSVKEALKAIEMKRGDVVLLNDPFRGEYAPA